MERGLFVFQSNAFYKLDRGEIDFMWLHASCLQACYAAESVAVSLFALQGY
jgi:glyoxylate utilization-related uncharacterized protein